MEFEGTVFKILPVKSGVSARGEWQRQEVVFDYSDGGNFSRKICVTFFNRPDEVAQLQVGGVYNVSVNIESREFNERWFTDVRVWRIQPKQQAAPAAASVSDAAPFGPETPYQAPAAAPAAPAPAEESDDLPF